MEFVVMRASNYNIKETMEFKTLEELQDFAKIVKNNLIIAFPHVESCGGIADPLGDIGEIIVYDTYVE